MYTKTLTLDLGGEYLATGVTAKSGDKDSRQLIIDLTQDGQAYTVPSGVTAELRCTKPSGLVVRQPAAVSGSRVTVTLSEQALAEKGLVYADIVLIGSGGDRLSSASFHIRANPAAGEGAEGTSQSQIVLVEEALAAARAAVLDGMGDAVDEGVAAATARIEEVKASIPADYTALSNQVSSLSGEIENVNSAKISPNLFNIDVSEVGYYRTAQDTLVANELFVCTNLIDVKDIERLYLRFFNQPHEFVFYQVLKYDKNKEFIERIKVQNTTYEVGTESYVRFNIDLTLTMSGVVPKVPTDFIMISNNNILLEQTNAYYEPYKNFNRNIFDIALNENLHTHKGVTINKVTNTKYIINFGKASVILFYNNNAVTNSKNWNIGTLSIDGNILIPAGTDILGPIKLIANNDYIGGVHGDETTTTIKVIANGKSLNIEEVFSIACHNLMIVMSSNIFDEKTKEQVCTRKVQIIVEENKITVNNTYKATADFNLERATNGGLGACYTKDLISVITGLDYLQTPLANKWQFSNSHNNVMATLITNFGSFTVRNVKGYDKDTYTGFLHHFYQESEPRLKIYFDTYKSGNYNIKTGDDIVGEFEYVIN